MILPININLLQRELQKIDVHPASINIFENRSQILPLKILAVRTPAANIIKQELLSSGGDCAINRHCITGKIDHTDILLLGTKKHYYELIKKLEKMPFFGLQQLRQNLQDYLDSQSVTTTLASGKTLDYSDVMLMGIINMTDDSFYEQSRQKDEQSALKTAQTMVLDGASILDIGGQSTRPRAKIIDWQEEAKRVVPIIKQIKKHFPESIISIDSFNPETLEQALDAGGDIINDITGASNPKVIALAKSYNVPIIIMHMQGDVQTMQDNPTYSDVTAQVWQFLQDRVSTLIKNEIQKDKIIIDPGIGFGKTLEHNISLIKNLNAFTSLNLPILLGASRKSMIGQLLGDISAKDRLEGTIALTCQAINKGVNIFRVHDVKQNAMAIKIFEAVK